MEPHNCVSESTVRESRLFRAFLASLAAHAQGASALAHKLPGNLIEKAFSRSLDLINPLRELERTPSQVPAFFLGMCWRGALHAVVPLALMFII